MKARFSPVKINEAHNLATITNAPQQMRRAPLINQRIFGAKNITNIKFFHQNILFPRIASPIVFFPNLCWSFQWLYWKWNLSKNIT